MDTKDINATDIADNMRVAWAAFVRAEESRDWPPPPHPYVYASAYRECTRRMVLEMTHPEEMERFDDETLARFRRGKDRERDLLIDAARVGRLSDPPFEVKAQQQRFDVRDRKGRIVIRGKTDARVLIPKFHIEPPVECKAWSPFLTEKIKRFSDLLDSPWTKPGAYQLLSYLYGSGEALGFLLLDRGGLPSFIPVELYDEDNLERMERFLQKATEAADCAELGELPDYCNSADECQRCPFYGGSCNPPLYHEGASILTDPELEAILLRCIELKPAQLEYDHMWEKAKKRLRGVETGICGTVLIEGKWRPKSEQEYPEEVAKQVEAWKRQYTVKNAHGSFILEVTQFGEKAKTEAA